MVNRKLARNAIMRGNVKRGGSNNLGMWRASCKTAHQHLRDSIALKH